MTVRPKPKLNTALTEAVKEFGNPTTPHQLEERGVRNLRSVPVARISEMIEKAVNRTILERTLGAGNGDLGVLLEHAQVGLIGLLKGVEEVEASRGAISQSREELIGELAEMRRDRVRATTPLAADPDDPTVEKMRHAIRETFGKLGVTSTEGLRVEKQFTEFALVLLEEARRRAAAAQNRERDSQVDRLERRVTKLVESLAETEARLKEVAAMKNIDLGIASLYRVVQGLPEQESNRALKKQLMEVIFKANLEMQKKQSAAT
jgi:AcrR family transcriptional regulator